MKHFKNITIFRKQLRRSLIDLRKLFLTGLFGMLPLALTFYAVGLVFNFADRIPRELIAKMIVFLLSMFGKTVSFEKANIPGLGLLSSLLLIFIAGYISTNWIGKGIWKSLESWLLKIPLVGNIYTALKQIVYTISKQKKKAFKEVVLIEYPYRGCHTIGFVTSDAPPEIQKNIGEKMISVFVPTTPNPTSGFMLILKQKEIIKLNMTVEEAIKLVVSGGILRPENTEK
jgi:uncharacterized membrane protein